MKQRILITGSNGFIGQKLIEAVLTREKYKVYALSKGRNRHSKLEGYQYIDADVCDKQQMANLIAQIKPDVIIHTVAMANVETCEVDPLLCNKVNVEPIQIIIELSKTYSFHFIQLSTDFVFNGENGPYIEPDIPNPLNAYGRSKLEAERLIQASTMKWTIIRTILVYGLANDPQRSNLILWVKKSLEDGKDIHVVTDHYRMPTLVEDLTQAILGIIERKAQGVYHISGSELFTVYEIALKVAEVWSLDSSLIHPVLSSTLESSVARPTYTGFILDKASKELGFQPHTLKEGLEKMKQQMTN